MIQQLRSPGPRAQAVPETVRYIDGGEQTRTVTRRGSGDRSVDTVRVTEIWTPRRRIIINNSDVVSRFNRDRGRFQAAIRTAEPKACA